MIHTGSKLGMIPDLLSREVDTIEGYSHLLVKRELTETKMELQDAKGKLSQASKGDQQGVGDTPAGHIKSCSNHDS